MAGPSNSTRLYCQRREMENRIKEQLSLYAGRVSAETLRANQLRVCLAAAYVLMHGLRRLGVEGNGMGAGASDDDPAAAIEDRRADSVTVRKVWLSLASSYPWQGLFGEV